MALRVLLLVWRPIFRLTTCAKLLRVFGPARQSEISVDELIRYIPGPDFPTGALSRAEQELFGLPHGSRAHLRASESRSGHG